MDEPAAGVTITFREVYDQIVGMRTDVQRLTDNSKDVEQVLIDHESRLRSIEKWKYGIPSMVTLCAVATVVIEYFANR